MSWNRAMQIGGLVIIVVSIAAVALIIQTMQVAAANNFHQPAAALQTTLPSLSASSKGAVSSATLSNSSAHVVQIPLGAGKKGTSPQYFFPSTLAVPTGSTVTWLNRDDVGHTVTSVDFNSGLLTPHTPDDKNNFSGSSFTHTFTKSGTYSYFCQIHPYMSGAVYVDVQETQRRLVSTNEPGVQNTMIEMPISTAYANKNGPFYIPTNALVTSGSRVTWVNHDYIAHTATASDQEFNTYPVLPTESVSLIINGTYDQRIPYYCAIHPWMQGSVTIVPPS